MSEVKSYFEGYSEFVGVLMKKYKTHEQDFLHGPVGVSKEAGELLDAAYRYWNYNKPLTAEVIENVLEEAGDILFYLQLTLNRIGMTIPEAIENNRVKLGQRYKDNKYSNEAALARADKS